LYNSIGQNKTKLLDLKICGLQPKFFCKMKIISFLRHGYYLVESNVLTIL